jgi:hypothetical protein
MKYSVKIALKYEEDDYLGKFLSRKFECRGDESRPAVVYDLYSVLFRFASLRRNQLLMKTAWGIKWA